MKKGLILSLCVIAISLIVSCTPNVGGVGSIPDLEVNTYSVNDKVARLNSVAVMMVGENLSVVATPTAGIGSAEAILECDEYIFASVNPLLVGKSFNLKTETSLFTFISTLAGATLESVAPEMTSEIAAGEAQIIYENNIAVVKADITLIGGTTLKFVLSAEREVEVNSNTIARGNEEKPLRAAFYDEGDYATTLYFTPAGAEYYGELQNVTWYIYLGISNELIDGATHSLADMDGTSNFEFGVIDNQSSSKSIEIFAGYLRGATGYITISKTATATYKADISIKVQGVLYTASFEGTCLSVDYAPEKPINFFTYQSNEYTATSATLTQGVSVWSIEIATSSGKSVVLNAPKEFFNSGDGGRGFSQSADFAVIYDGTTYSKATGYSGTMISAYDDATHTIALDFFNNSDIKFNYTGVVEVK